MSVVWRHLGCLCLLLFGCVTVVGIDFDRDVRPLLSDRCFKCHGPDGDRRSSKLRLDTATGLSEANITVPGRPADSELFRRITADDPDELMPPPESGLALDAREREVIRRWIADGAKLAEHWSFRPLVKPEPPVVGATNWIANDIDRFVLARLEEEGLPPASPAPRNVLLRRVCFDLTGLPPAAQEVLDFEQDSDASAYANRVAKLLASPRYGERMAVEWMDAARYADSNGYLFDYERTMWPWRNWVIEAYNQNLPYAEFITAQLAGDLLENPSIPQLIATGFNRNHPFTAEDGVFDEEFRLNYVADRVTTMGTVFLGLTLECARCHDHKYDPITQEDFYQLSAFFNLLPESGVLPDNARHAPPAIPTPSIGQVETSRSIEERMRSLKAQVLRDDPEADALQKQWEARAENYWSVIRPGGMQSANGATMSLLADGSVLLSGRNPEQDRHLFEFKIDTAMTLTGLRLEALPHASMTAGGPGRSALGGAVLNHIQIARIDTNSNHVVIAVRRAEASVRDERFPVAGALNSFGSTGWGLPPGPVSRRRSAVFELGEPTRFAAGDVLEVRLSYTGPFAQHAIGRIRFATTGLLAPARLDPTGFVHELARLPAKDRSPVEGEMVRAFFRTTKLAAYNRFHSALLGLEAQEVRLMDGVARPMIMSDSVNRETFILERGRFDRPLSAVRPDTPACLPPMAPDLPRNRLGLARWLVSGDQPLTARVFVNRIWHQLFGVGLVKTVEDFGSQGERPSHPRLLDWLAADFVEHGWDIKRLLALIVTSATYRQSSVSPPTRWEQDPENRRLSRGPRFRLSAEMIRDAALAYGGLLVAGPVGPGVKPYQPPNLWRRLTNRERFRQIYVAGNGDDLYRRSIYTYWRRALHPPNMAAFDAPNREVCVFRRRLTNTPQQALVLLHDPQFVEAARALAQRMLTETAFGTTPDSRIRQAFRVVTSRFPDPLELSALGKYLRSETDRFRLHTDEATELLKVGESPLRTPGREVELAAYTMVARLIMNLGETITRN